MEIEWKTYWVSPVEMDFLEMEIREKSSGGHRGTQRQRGPGFSVLWMLIYVSTRGERNVLPFTEEREGNSREGQTESECK